MPRRTAWRAWSPYTICFAMTFVSCTAELPTRLLLLLFGLAFDGGELLLGVAFDDGQHVILLHDEVLLPLQLDLLARILAEQDPVARFDVERDPLAVVVHLPVADGGDRALLRLLFGAVRDDDPPDLLVAFLEAVDDDPVVEGSNIHEFHLQTDVTSGDRPTPT